MKRKRHGGVLCDGIVGIIVSFLKGAAAEKVSSSNHGRGIEPVFSWKDEVEEEGGALIERVAVIWRKISKVLRCLNDCEGLVEFVHADSGVPDKVVRE